MEGYECKALEDGSKINSILDQEHFDLIILDIMMPGLTGYEVLEKIRIKHESIPVIFLSARDESKDKVTGLKMGAEDYITKPFHMEELLLRIKNTLRRASPDQSVADNTKGIFYFGSNWIDFAQYKAAGNEGEFTLSKKEVMLLKYLIDKKNEVISRQQILQHVWGYDIYPSTRTIDNFILSFRKQFEPDPRNPIYFHSIRGIGYKFTLYNH